MIKYMRESNGVVIDDNIVYQCDDENIETLVIPDGIICISDDAFYGCSRLRDIQLPDSLVHIENCAFADCYSLGEITIPSKVSNIESSAFAYCYNLKKVDLKTTDVNICLSAFLGCSDDLVILCGGYELTYDDMKEAAPDWNDDDDDDELWYTEINIKAAITVRKRKI